jgi:hypothetical protein
MSSNVFKNTDLLARAPLYVLLPSRGSLESVARFQGTFFARADYLTRQALTESSATTRAHELKAFHQTELAMLQVALDYFSGNSDEKRFVGQIEQKEVAGSSERLIGDRSLGQLPPETSADEE